MAAPVLESYTNENSVSSNLITVDKPASLAVGELLILLCRVSTGTLTIPVGWTQIDSITLSGNTLYAVYKKADSGDVAAANFQFSISGVATHTAALCRVSGNSYSPYFVSAKESTSNDPTPSFTGLTPSNTNNLLIMLVSCINAGGATNMSAYAIATSNPAWTEILDDTVITGIAHATRPEGTATGNFSYQVDDLDGNTDPFAILISISETKDFSVSETVDTTESYPNSISYNLTDTVDTTEEYIQDKSREWKRANKPSTTWTFIDKQ